MPDATVPVHRAYIELHAWLVELLWLPAYQTMRRPAGRLRRRRIVRSQIGWRGWTICRHGESAMVGRPGGVDWRSGVCAAGGFTAGRPAGTTVEGVEAVGRVAERIPIRLPKQGSPRRERIGH